MNYEIRQLKSGIFAVSVLAILPYLMATILWYPVIIRDLRILIIPAIFLILWSTFVFIAFTR
ncbi:MAG: hypothetical protein AABY22_26620 [Nanoarchaeota archaeon]